jgi:hypothetical protein
MAATGRERAERLLAWEHQERALLAAYDRALGMGAARGGLGRTLRRLVAPAAAA